MPVRVDPREVGGRGPGFEVRLSAWGPLQLLTCAQPKASPCSWGRGGAPESGREGHVPAKVFQEQTASWGRRTWTENRCQSGGAQVSPLRTRLHVGGWAALEGPGTEKAGHCVGGAPVPRGPWPPGPPVPRAPWPPGPLAPASPLPEEAPS